MPQFTESVVEEATLNWFDELGYAVLHGPDIAPGKQVQTRPPVILRHFFGYQSVIDPGIVGLRFSSAAEGR